MKLLVKSVIFIILALSSFQALAGKDPVSWTVTTPFPSKVVIERDYEVTYVFKSNLPFTMVKPLVINKIASPSADFTYDDQCTGHKLSHNQTCSVKITLTPTVTGKYSVQLVIAGYDDNRVPVPALTTEVEGQGAGDVYGAVTQSLPKDLYIGASGSFSFSFTNHSVGDISNVVVNVTGNGGGTVTSAKQNCGSTLSKDQSCVITGTYVPTTSSPTSQGVSASFTYGSGTVVNLSTNTTVKVGAGVIASFIGYEYLAGIAAPAAPSFAPPYPNGSGIFPTQTVGVLFTNTGTISDPTGAATISTADDPPELTVSDNCATITMATAGYNNCRGAVLNVGASCQMIGVVDTSACDPTSSPVPVTVTAEVTSSTVPNNVSLSTTTTLIPSGDIGTSRTIEFVNDCTFDVWYSLSGASEAGSCDKTSGVGCPSGTSCNKEKGTCFWRNYPYDSPTPNLLTSGGGTDTVTIPAFSTDPTVQWSGAISASLNCSGGTCGQAACSNPNGVSCAPGVGFNQPATQAEFTMLLNGADTYDVETINGFHIPISITPIYSVTPSVPAPTPTTASEGYICGIAGNNATLPGITGGCDWEAAVAPGTQYTWITTATGSCSSNANCSSSPNLVCGMDSNFNRGCGQFLGYWTADQVCGSTTNATIRSLFHCDTQLSTLVPTGLFPSGDTLTQLYQCNVPKSDTTNAKFNSCYLNYTASSTNNPQQCCGCVDWWTISGIAANPTSNTCIYTDPIWESNVKSTVEWMKKVCPTIYVYPFDDKTSTYTCTNTINNGTANSVSYQITFCPGNTGLPSGVALAGDGR